MSRNISLLIDYTRSYLRNMHVDHQAIVSIDLGKFVISKIFGVDVMLDIAMFMGENNIGMSVFVTRCFEVKHLQVLFNFGLINTEIEVLLRSYLSISFFFQGH